MQVVLEVTQYLRGFGFSDWVIFAALIVFLLWRVGYIDRLFRVAPWLGMIFSVNQQARIESAHDTREHRQQVESSTLEHEQTRAVLQLQNETFLLNAVVDTAQVQGEFIQGLVSKRLERLESGQLELMQNQLHMIRLLTGGPSSRDTRELKKVD